MLEIDSTMMFGEYLKCPICNKAPNSEMLKAVMAEGSSYNITHFDPKDPLIVSESEIYCSTECYIRAVIKQEMAYEW